MQAVLSTAPSAPSHLHSAERPIASADHPPTYSTESGGKGNNNFKSVGASARLLSRSHPRGNPECLPKSEVYCPVRTCTGSAPVRGESSLHLRTTRSRLYRPHKQAIAHNARVDKATPPSPKQHTGRRKAEKPSQIVQGSSTTCSAPWKTSSSLQENPPAHPKTDQPEARLRLRASPPSPRSGRRTRHPCRSRSPA